jgi:hypothetical protein
MTSIPALHDTVVDFKINFRKPRMKAHTMNSSNCTKKSSSHGRPPVNALTKKIGLFTSTEGETKKEGDEENKSEKENKLIDNHFSVHSKLWDVQVKTLTNKAPQQTTGLNKTRRTKNTLHFSQVPMTGAGKEAHTGC